MAKKQDPKEVSLKQKYEAYYIAATYFIPLKIVREVIKKVGKSRRKIYAELRLQGYIINKKTSG